LAHNIITIDTADTSKYLLLAATMGMPKLDGALGKKQV